jgi:sialidase-1
MLATGPGHAIEHRNGRLVVPVWLSLGQGSDARKPSANSVIFSDDQGRTLRVGDIAVPDTPEFVSPSETVAEQLADGRVMLNARSNSKENRRVVVYSGDGATSWSSPLPPPVAGADLHREHGAVQPGEERTRRNRLLFSNPRQSGPARRERRAGDES